MVAPYHRNITCPACGTVNHVITEYGYGPAEETEHAHCLGCGALIESERCYHITVKAPQPEA